MINWLKYKKFDLDVNAEKKTGFFLWRCLVQEMSFFTVQNQGEICGMRHQVDCDCFFCSWTFVKWGFSQEFLDGFGKGAHQQHPKNWNPNPRFLSYLGSSPWQGLAYDLSAVSWLLSKNPLMVGAGSRIPFKWQENMTFDRGFQFQCLLKDENYTLSANFAESFFFRNITSWLKSSF